MPLKKFLSIVLAFLLISGCGAKPEPLTLDEADERLLQILKNDFGYEAVVQRIGQTVWVYVPQRESLYQIEGVGIPPQETPRDYSLQFLEGSFINNRFIIEYDVTTVTRSSRGNGISTKYSLAFNEASQNILSGLTRSYFAVQEPPDFFVAVFADITSGILSQRTIYAPDLKKTYSGALPPEEYSLRIVNDLFGNKEAVDDKKGQSLNIAEIQWPQFLIDQAKQRIRFKFQQSDFPPQETPQSEILNQVAKTLLIYDFIDFTEVILKDLRNDESKSFSREQIQAMRPILGIPRQDEEPKGQIITLDLSRFLSGEEDPDKE